MQSTERISPTERLVLSAKDVAQLLSCSEAQVHKLRTGGILPEDYRIFGESSPRGYRWKRATIDLYLAVHASSHSERDEEEARPFVPVDVKRFTRKENA